MQRVELRTLVTRAVLLDLDGTVWDSRLWFAMVIARLSHCDESKIETQLADGANVIHLAKSYGVSKTRLVKEAIKNTDRLKIYYGVVETLNRLREHDTPIGVVSNLSGSLVTALLHSTGLEGHFATIVTPGRGIRAKPHPHGINRALREMEWENHPKTWYVGDGEVDARAAHAARVRFAWASYGYEKDEPEGVDAVIDRFEDVFHL